MRVVMSSPAVASAPVTLMLVIMPNVGLPVAPMLSMVMAVMMMYASTALPPVPSRTFLNNPPVSVAPCGFVTVYDRWNVVVSPVRSLTSYVTFTGSRVVGETLNCVCSVPPVT